MGVIFGTVLAFLIVFGILVFIHEFGHFFMAKLVGVRVEVFSFGYGKRLLGFKKGQTDYRISVLPMGGYVKFLGEGIFEPDRALAPDDFMAKKRWQRFLVILMGSVMNIVLAIVIVAGTNMAGVTFPEYLDQKPVIGWIEPGSPADKAGLRVEDEILSVDGKKVPTWSDLELAIGTKPDKQLTLEIERDGRVQSVHMVTGKLKGTKYEIGYAGFAAKILTQVQVVSPGSPAEKGGMRAGDLIQAINGQPINANKFLEVIEKSPGKELEFGLIRDGKPVTLFITPRQEGKLGKIGVLQSVKSVVKKFGFLAAIKESVKYNAKLFFMVIEVIKNLLTGQASVKQLSGPLDIAGLSYATFRMGFMAFISWIGFISLQLGVFNLFPIPVFDGGQLFVLILEGIFRRDFSPKARQIWMQIGFVIFIILIGFILLNDIVKRLPNGWKSLVPF
jgi:regulator of sigma E protease